MTRIRVRILIVDNERFLRDSIHEILVGQGHDCVVVEDGGAALEEARDPAVGVVLLDIRLPEPDGVEVLQQLLQLRPELRVVMLSAPTEQEPVIEALRLGASDYLAKPLHKEELRLSVERAIRGYQVESGWQRLRQRLNRLVLRMTELGARVRREAGPAREAALVEGATTIASEVLEAGRSSLLQLGEDGRTLRVSAALGHPVKLSELETTSVGESVAGLAIERGEPLLVVDADHEPEVAKRLSPGRYASDSFAVAPLRCGERSLGVLCVTERIDGGVFGPEDLALLQLLAMQVSDSLAAGTASGRAPTVCDESASQRDSELARMICESVVSEADPERVIRAALRQLASSLRASPVSLYLLDAASGELRCEGQWEGGLRTDRKRLPATAGLSGMVLQTGHLVATPRPEQDPRFEIEVDTPEDGRPGPLLCLPLRLRGKVVGIARAFLEEGDAPSARTGEVVAATLSAAVRNLLLYRSLVESIEEVAEVRRQAQPGASHGAVSAPEAEPRQGGPLRGGP